MALRRVIRTLVPNSVMEWRKARRHRKHFGDADYAEAFKIVHDKNLWKDPESLSGGGSTVAFTQSIRQGLSDWLNSNEIKSLVDLPCGDFNWMRLVDFPAGMEYIGIDIVEDLIAANLANHASDRHRFEVGDIIAGPVPKAEVYFCRDVFIHFPNSAVEKSIQNVKAAGAKYLIATTFPDVTEKTDTVFPNSRRQNMALFLGEPEELLDDNDDGRTDKFMGVWKLD
ncbi:MAG: class I SAM-dependent methyltransferase [Erythrobacter sp.]